MQQNDFKLTSHRTCSGTAAHVVKVLYFCGSVDTVSFNVSHNDKLALTARHQSGSNR